MTSLTSHERPEAAVVRRTKLRPALDERRVLVVGVGYQVTERVDRLQERARNQSF